jgi:hypothetical protein
MPRPVRSTSRKAAIGAIVTTAIGLNDTANCLGIHLNMIVTPDPSMNDLTEREKSALAGMQHYADWDSGYSKQQSTRPQTLGYGLADSPAAKPRIVEKFWSWMTATAILRTSRRATSCSQREGCPTPASSARLYWESFNKVSRDPVKIPTGAASSRKRSPLLAPLGRSARETGALASTWRPLRRVRTTGDVHQRGAHLLPTCADRKRIIDRRPPLIVPIP